MNNYQVIEFKNENVELSVNVSPLENTIWMSLEQMVLLFGRDKSVISRHIKGIFSKEELDQPSTVAKNATVQIEGERKILREITFYNLDVVISVGYRVNSIMGVKFRKWANSVLREYLLKGYVINENRTLITDENYVNLINRVDSIDSRLQRIENEEQFYKKEKLIVDGEVFDGINYLESIVSNANKKILLIDPYVDSKALNILKNVKDNIGIRIITSSKSKLSNKDIILFIKQYNKSVILDVNDNFHDRYLFIDDKVFHLGSSINYLGKRISQISEVIDSDIISYLRKRVEY